jgi:hypothetical protein
LQWLFGSSFAIDLYLPHLPEKKDKSKATQNAHVSKKHDTSLCFFVSPFPNFELKKNVDCIKPRQARYILH